MSNDIMMFVCPVCGDSKADIPKPIGVKCGFCGSNVIFTDVSQNDYLYKMDDGQKRAFKRTAIETYAKSSPLFDESKYNERENSGGGSYSTPVPKCPTCGSVNIRRITGTEKVVNVAMFGLFGNKRRQQFECSACSYRW